MRLVLPLLLVSSVALAAPTETTGPHVAKTVKVTTGGCSTDGGSVKCSSGVRYLGDLIQLWSLSHLEESPIACAAEVKPSTVTVRFGYDYDDGKVFVQDSDKVQAKWPACVKTYVDQASVKLLEMWRVLQPLDPTIDVSSAYKVQIQIKK